jgi:uncharacterized glyoxalase superfamily protein PhnB
MSSVPNRTRLPANFTSLPPLPARRQFRIDSVERLLHVRLDLLHVDVHWEGFSVSLQVKEPAEAERIFHALANEGKVQMPIQETFWAARFGMLVDRFGIPWMINCEQGA